MRYFVTLFLAFSFMASISQARPLTPEEETSLGIVTAQFMDDMKQENATGIITILPERIVNHLSLQAEVSPEYLLQMLSEQIENLFANTSFVSIHIDIAGLDVTDGKNSDGDMAVYAIIPFSYSFLHSDKINKSTSRLIAIKERAKWGLIRVAPNQAGLLIELYPFLKGEPL